VRYFFDLVQARGILFAEIQDEEHGLLGEELEAADALLVFGGEFHSRAGAVVLERLLAAFEQFELVVEFGVFDLLAVFFEAFEALFDHDQVAEDQFGSTSSRSRTGSTEPFSWGTVSLSKTAQHVGEGIHDAQAGEVTRVAQGFLRNRREVDVLHDRVRDFGRLEDLGQRVQARGPAPWPRRRGRPWCPGARIRARR
jgi:hypothetical protein